MSKQMPAGADVSDATVEYFWRTDRARGVREYVRKSDGRVVDSQRLPREAGAKELTVAKQKKHQEGDKHELSGQKFNSLEVIGYSGKQNKIGSWLVLCKCECGSEVEETPYNVKTGRRRHWGGAAHAAGRSAEKPVNGRKRTPGMRMRGTSTVTPKGTDFILREKIENVLLTPPPEENNGHPVKARLVFVHAELETDGGTVKQAIGAMFEALLQARQ